MVFRTVRSQFLSELPSELFLQEINERFDNYIENVYYSRVHGSTRQAPIKRYQQDSNALRRAPSELPEYFCWREERTVNNARTVRLDGGVFEAPSGLAGHRGTQRFVNYGRLEVFIKEVLIGFIKELEIHGNSRVKRESSLPPVVAVNSLINPYMNTLKVELHE